MGKFGAWFGNRILSLRSHSRRGLSLILLSNILSSLLNVVLIKFLTNKYSVTEFSTYTLVMGINALPQMVLFGSLSAAVFPFVSEQKNDAGQCRQVQRDIFELFFLTVVILAGLIAVSCAYSTEHFGLFVLALVFSAGTGALSLLDSLTLANSRMKEFALFPLISLLMKILVVALLFRTEISPALLISVFGVLQGVQFFSSLHYLNRQGVTHYWPNGQWRSLFDIQSGSKRRIIAYGSNFALWGFFAWCQAFLDRWLLHRHSTPGSVAMYAVYYQYGFYPFTLAAAVLSQYVTPLYFNSSHSPANSKRFVKVLVGYTLSFLVLSLLFLPLASTLIAPLMIPILTNAAYVQKVSCFPYLVVAGCFFCGAQLLAVPLLSSKLVTAVRFPKIASSVLSVLCMWLLVQKFQMLGIVLSVVIGNAFYFATLLVAIKRHYFSPLKTAVYAS